MLKDKVAIITGGTKGIGFATVKKFLDNEAKVILLGSKKETVNEALNQLKAFNNNYIVEGYAPNLIDEKEITELFFQINQRFGHIDILVNNAGVASNTKIEDYTITEYEKICNLNFKAVFICCKAVIPYLKTTKGVILNTSSMVGKYGQPSGVIYPATKFAVNGLTISLARELAPFKIRVNAVAPGIINTQMLQNLPSQAIEPLIKSIPLGRIGNPEDIANSFLFLASEMASYITGVILPVDGLARN